MSRWRMRHIALHVAYLGHNYHGLAVQDAPSALADGVSRRPATGAGDGMPTPSAPAVGAKRARPDGSTPSPSTTTTIESALFAALLQTCLIESRAGAGFTRCGRTDKGVSAAGQILALRVRSNARRTGDKATAVAPLPSGDGSVVGGEVEAPGHGYVWRRDDGLPNEGDAFPPPHEELDYAATLNKVLPADIRVLGWADVDDTFSARFTATDRVYRYYFVPRGMNLNAMREAGRRMIGFHDFRNFCKYDITATQHFCRRIASINIVPADSPLARSTAYPVPSPAVGAVAMAGDGGDVGGSVDGCCDMRVHYVEVVGNAFLWHQIRCVVAILFHVGRGFESPSVVDHLLDVGGACPGRPRYELAGELPLCLHHCGFGEMDRGGSGDVEDDGDGSSGDAGANYGPSRFVRGDAGLYHRMHHSVTALRAVTSDLESQWSALTMKAALLRGIIDRVGQLPVTVAALSGAGLQAVEEGLDPTSSMTWADAVRRFPALAASRDNADYAIVGLPPGTTTTTTLPGLGGMYVPIAARPCGARVEDAWNALTPDQRAAIMRQHPVNAAKLEAAAAAVRPTDGPGGDDDGTGGATR